MQVVSTSALPIDLAAQVTAALPGSVVHVPAHGHVGIAGVELGEADALVCLLLDRIDAKVFARAPKLQLVANCAVGFDNIDLAAATAAGVAVTNTPDVLTEATAELAFTLLLACARRLGEGERLVRSGIWTGWALDQLIGVGLLGKTLGIVGYGRIGQAMARRAVGFGMRVIYCEPGDPDGPGSGGYALGGAEQFAERSGAVRRVALDELFATSDAVSLHCPLTPETHHLVNARRLATMKPTALLVNTARGGCVDEAALIQALTERRLFGAALDVYAREPALDPGLFHCPGLVLAPHIGSATSEARTAMAQLCADSVIAVLRGQRPTQLVNDLSNTLPLPWNRRS
ncbi:MAG TPA: D-glycerate dehydrogenase [Kofleriaceae bacterium]|nr:D-glycerate dehydrogenase [Kofleriaceae bacterium]